MKRFLMVAALAMSPATVQAGPLDIFSDIFVFGDSLSDGGNLFIRTDGDRPDSDLFPGTQFTNGDTWATQLGLTPSLSVNGGTNYAFGGARARDNGPLPPDAVAQITSFRTSGAAIDDDSLAALWIGGNDVRDAFLDLDRDFATLAALTAVDLGFIPINDVVDAFFSEGTILGEALDAVSDSLDLLERSALKNIAVVNLPNFARVPEVLRIAGTLDFLEDTALNFAKAVSQKFNAELQEKINALPKGISTSYVDIFGLLEDVAADPDAFGFAGIQTPCLFALPDVAPECPGFLYYDSIHPTEAAHALIAERFTKTVAPVPLPAGGLLLVAGLGGLFILRRKSAEV